MASFNKLIFTIIFMLSAGCVSLQKEGMEVQVLNTSKNLPPKCKKLGDLESFSMWGEEPAMAYLRNEAGFNGATHLVTIELIHTFWGFTYSAQTFKCP